MKITREIDTSNATYSLDGINQEQFSFLLSALEQQSYRVTQCLDYDPEGETPIGELLNKFNKMNESSITVIK